jgi:hypothetical protein
MMTIIVALALFTLFALMAMAVAAAVVSRQDVLHSATVNPFAPGIAGPSADTMQNDQAMVQTVMAPLHDWEVATFADLTQVEDLLDCLEAHGVATREVIAVTDNCFAVRWK